MKKRHSPASKAEIDPEEPEIRNFLEKHWHWYATEAERHQYYLALRRRKVDTPRCVGSAFERKVQAEWACADEATRLAVEEGMESIRKKAIERIYREFREVQGITGRCPKCGRVLRTPVAKQCRWCHHDWHST